ncbi:MAG: DUF3822 family protein [Bacteroidota bacterium]
MGRLKTTIIDELFSQKSANKYELSILIGMDSFLYLVFDQNRHILLLKEYDLEAANSLQGERILKLFEEDRLLKLLYSTVKVAFLGQKQIFVPNRLYHPDQKRIYLNHVANLSVSEVVKSDDLSLLRAQNIYSADRAVLNLMQQMFPRAKYYHSTSALYLGYRQHCEQGKGNVFLNLRDQYLQLFFFQDRELLYTNAFQIENPDDLVYYTMMLFQQFNLSGNSQKVQVTGDFPENSDYHRKLSRYVKQIFAITELQDFQYSETTRHQLNNHAFFDLLSIPLCG